MNLSNLKHAGYALAMQAVIGLLTGDWFAGACFGIAFFVSREHAQREYHLGGPLNVKPLDGFTGWDRDRYLDAGLPIVACSIVWAWSSF